MPAIGRSRNWRRPSLRWHPAKPPADGSWPETACTGFRGPGIRGHAATKHAERCIPPPRTAACDGPQAWPTARGLGRLDSPPRGSDSDSGKVDGLSSNQALVLFCAHGVAIFLIAVLQEGTACTPSRGRAAEARASAASTLHRPGRRRKAPHPQRKPPAAARRPPPHRAARLQGATQPTARGSPTAPDHRAGSTWPPYRTWRHQHQHQQMQMRMQMRMRCGCGFTWPAAAPLARTQGPATKKPA